MRIFLHRRLLERYGHAPVKRKFGLVVFYIALFIGFIFILSYALGNSTKSVALDSYSEVVDCFNRNEVVSFTVSNKYVLTMTTTDGTVKTYRFDSESFSIFYHDMGETIERNHAQGTLVEWEYEPVNTWPWWVSLIPTIVIGGLIILWLFFMNASMNKNGGAGRMNNFGKARVRTPATNGESRVLFRDVAGADEEKAELQEIVHFLKNPSKYHKLGAKIPSGVLLVGPPGTGKTLLAKAVAGEAGVPFFSISGSDFVEMYVGVGASRVRDLFDTARKGSPSIVFIDEIDAVGRHRGAGLGGGHDEREQTLNQLLVEMDGFASDSAVIVIAATNRPDILDPALLRPGRFDRQITVNYPDLQGRTDILKVHARNKPMEKDVDLAEIARVTIGFTGADLANLLNEAALLAARRGKALVGMYDIKDALIRIEVGPKKKSRKMKDRDLKNTAYHEAGHAIVHYALPTLDPVTQISIIPSGRALGYTMSAPTEDRYSEYKQELLDTIASLLGGRVAEELIFGDVSGGASNDIQRATKLAQKMVTKLGMSSSLGPICYGSDQGEVFLGRDFSSAQDYSDATANQIDVEIRRIITEAYENAKRILTENMEKLHFISEFLLKNETMDGEQFAAAMSSDISFEELENMTEAKLRRSREENDLRIAENAKKEQEEKERLERARAAGADDRFRRDGNDRGNDRDDDDRKNDGDDENRFAGKH